MKKILLGIIVIVGLISPLNTFAVSGNSVRETNEIKNQIKDDIKNIKEQVRENVKEKIISRAGDLKLFKNKKIVITQGELTAIVGSTLTVKEGDTQYQVIVDDKTQLRRKFWGKSELSEFSIGDKLNIVGIWSDDAKTSIIAQMIKNTSIQMRHGTFFGIVKTITGNTLVIDSEKRGEQTVTVSDTAEIVNRKQEKILITDILVGHKIRVKGLWNSLKSTITEVEHIKDFSLPLQPKSSVAPSIEPTPVALPIVSPVPSPTV